MSKRDKSKQSTNSSTNSQNRTLHLINKVIEELEIRQTSSLKDAESKKINTMNKKRKKGI